MTGIIALLVWWVVVVLLFIVPPRWARLRPMSRLRLTAADVVAVTAGALAGWLIALGVIEAWLRRQT